MVIELNKKKYLFLINNYFEGHLNIVVWFLAHSFSINPPTRPEQSTTSSTSFMHLLGFYSFNYRMYKIQSTKNQ